MTDSIAVASIATAATAATAAERVTFDWAAVADVVPLPPRFLQQRSAGSIVEQPLGIEQAPAPKIAVVGYGYWGQKLAAAFSQQGATVIPVDPNQPGTQPWATVLADATIQAVVIATPEKTHAALSLAALAAGKAVLVEKPAATQTAEWQKVVQLAQQCQLPLLVEYTFCLSQAAQIWRQWEKQFASQLGELQSLYSRRWASLTSARIQAKAMPVWLDAAIHDLYLLRWLWAGEGRGWQVISAVRDETAAQTQPVAATLQADLTLPHGQAQFHAEYSWVAKNPERFWQATFAGGTMRWERRGAADWLQVATSPAAGQPMKILAEVSLEDTHPSPLDRTADLFLAWVAVKKPWSVAVQSQWQKYWVSVERDIIQLGAIR